MNIFITKRDGTKELFNADKINKSIERACAGLEDPISMVTQIATDTRLTMYDGMTTEELDKATINAAVQNIQYDTDFDKVATRLFLKTVYKKVIGDYDTENPADLAQKHRDGFIQYVKRGVAENRLHPDMLAKFDLERLADALRVDRDDLFLYSGVDGLMNRYSIKNAKQESTETPQYLFMRIGMGLSYNESNPTEWAIRFYDKMSKHEFIAGGSTNLAAGTNRPSLSNCFLLEMHDNMEHIAKTVSDVMLLSKASGGIGLSVTKLRATGSPLKSNFGGASTGPTTFAKVIDTAIRAIQRGGKKKGALCFYMENWHLDFPEFIDWKHNAGDDYLRMRTANTAAFLSDEFMKRVVSGQDWYMFDPAEAAELNELYGKAFSEKYKEYCAKAERGELRAYKKVPASEQWRQILTSLQSTSHPWITWKDPINLRALNNNTGTIHMSNLCTEICLPQDRDNIAVCNLISVNLAAHVANKEVNWARLEDSVRLAIRQLDNLIDINKLPIPEAIKSDSENRAVGLGVMGLADVFEKLGLSYDSEHAWDFSDRIFEFVSYMAIDESANLAQARGSYKNFSGSRWSMGQVPVDTLRVLEEDRGRQLTVFKESRHKGLNWDLLRSKVKKGMRNATLMAVAPNANIGLVAGTTPGMDPRFAQVFSRNKISGKYMDINHNLVKDLKNMGLWEKVRGEIIASQGDISNIEGIPEHIKDIYKTSFTTSPLAFIEVAARAQKWIDQAISRNMYLETRDIDETMKIYTAAWEKGVKTTYYLHMKPRHTAEQSTVRVNKAEVMGKKGFAAVATNLTDKKATFEAPLQKSLDIVEPAPLRSEPAPIMAVKAEAKEQKATVSWNIAKPAAPQAAPATFAAPKQVSFAAAPVAPVAAVAAQAAAPAPKAEAKGGYQSLSDLAGIAGVATKAASAEAAPSFKIVNGRRVFAPSDPSEENLCDSCQ